MYISRNSKAIKYDFNRSFLFLNHPHRNCKGECSEILFMDKVCLETQKN